MRSSRNCAAVGAPIFSENMVVPLQRWRRAGCTVSGGDRAQQISQIPGIRTQRVALVLLAAAGLAAVGIIRTLMILEVFCWVCRRLGLIQAAPVETVGALTIAN